MFEDIKTSISSTATSTFTDNMKIPIHRWFRYSAGFSARWVEEVVNTKKQDENLILFDPFVGSGTTLLASQQCGINSIGLDAHPFVHRIARAKVGWNVNATDFKDFALSVLSQARITKPLQSTYPKLIYACYPSEILTDLDRLKNAWLMNAHESTVSELCWLAITAILRQSSPVGTSQMELIQPKKQKGKFKNPFEAFSQQIDLMYSDIKHVQLYYDWIPTTLYQSDAREASEIDSSTANIVITSPPYANNFDYADATRLEMSFWGEIEGWGDLQHAVRQYLVRSCSQHMSFSQPSLERFLSDPLLLPIIDELEPICKNLEHERLLHGGKKNYHLMIVAYFSDLARVWHQLRRICQPNSTICFVIGDSAPYGVYVPVHEFLGKLALASGFISYTFEKTRDRNVKWKNRKHQVPLCEGHLWVKG